jgi:hypothetical protein
MPTNTPLETERLKYIADESNKDNSTIKNLLLLYNIGGLKTIGGRRYKYDLQEREGDKKTIEHKGVTMKNINRKCLEFCPWDNGHPQVVNASCSNFTYSQDFAKYWYDNAIPELRKKFTDLPEPPVWNEWYNKEGKTFPGGNKTKGYNLSPYSLGMMQKQKTNKKWVSKFQEDTQRKFWKTVMGDQEKFSNFEKRLQEKFSGALKKKDYFMLAGYENVIVDIIPKKIVIIKTPTLSNLKAALLLGEENGDAPVFKLEYSLTSNPNKKFFGEARMRFRNWTGVCNISWNIK